jgi:hypothetical protein
LPFTELKRVPRGHSHLPVFVLKMGHFTDACVAAAADGVVFCLGATGATGAAKYSVVPAQETMYASNTPNTNPATKPVGTYAGIVGPILNLYFCF